MKRVRNNELLLLKIFLFVYYANWTFIFFFVPVYLREVKNFSIGMIGTLGAISAFLGAISQIFVGYLSDRIKKRKPFLILSALGLLFLYLFIFPKLNSFIAFILVYAFIGIFMNTLTTLSNVLTFDYSSSEGTGKSFASVRVWAPIGFLTMMLTIGFYPKLAEPNIMFTLIPLIFLLNLIVILLLKEPELKTGIKTIELRDLQRFISQPKVRKFLLFYMFYLFAMSGAAGNVNLLIRYLGGSNSDISWALSVCSITEIPTTFLWGYLADKIGRLPLLMFTSIVLPIRVFLYSLTSKALDVILIQLFTHGLTFAIMITVSAVYINDLVSEEERASAQGTLSMAGAFSQTLSALVSGNVADMVGLKGMYVFLTFIALISTFLGLRLKK
ncbi:MAG: MFS transporter [Dictyoglomus sp. NZ13-RE01]|nr:MAG: MFS transporter [Dictyoglomus sp. NZ13-RE01]